MGENAMKVFEQMVNWVSLADTRYSKAVKCETRLFLKKTS